MELRRIGPLLAVFIGTGIFSVTLQAAEPTGTTPAISSTTPQQESPEKSIKPKPRITTRTEAEISAMTSETSDQLYGRVNITRMVGKSGWWIRTGYGSTRTRTYTTKKVNETELGTFNLDSQYRKDRGRSYRFVSAVAAVRNRSPYSSTYGDRTGYYMLNVGVGRTITPALEGELALAKITRYEEEVDNRITPVYSLRLKADLTDSMALDGYTHLVQPFTEDTLVDTRVNLTYKFAPSLSIRLTYVANNMLRPLLSHSGWDRSFRVSLVFGSTRN